MPELNPYAKAAIAAALIGAGVLILMSAVTDYSKPCEDCGGAEEVAAEVAQASAELAEPPTE